MYYRGVNLAPPSTNRSPPVEPILKAGSDESKLCSRVLHTLSGLEKTYNP